MDFSETFRSAIEALRLNVMRSSLTMLGIIIGITSVILIYSIGQGAVAFITNELTSFGTDYFQINPGKSQLSTVAGSESLNMSDLEAIRAAGLANVKDLAGVSMSSLMVTGNGEEKEVLVYGMSPAGVDMLKPELYEGESITDENESSTERVVVLGASTAEDFFGKESSVLGESVIINKRNYRVTGVLHSSSVLAGSFVNKAIFVPLSVMTSEILGNNKLMEIDVSVHDQNTINQTMADVEEILRDEHNLKDGDENNFRIESAKDILATTQTITSLLTAMVSAISAISLVVGGVGVMNIMLVSVTERTHEIGLLKSIGAKQKDILTQFLVEAVVLTLTGGVIGIILGLGLAFLVSLGFKVPFVFSLPAVLVAVSVSTLVGIIFGLYPARKAARLAPIEALRYQ